jgi:DNA-binding transcriptional regulator/RsmH inhibitor MraZ
VGKKVVVVGMFDHLEIWDSDIFLKNQENAESTFSADAMELNLN